MASELNHHVGYSRENECWFVRFYPYQTEQQAKDAVSAFTRPAPAATDTGLETVEHQALIAGDWVTVTPEYNSFRQGHRELVTRSQAEELLAAEREKVLFLKTAMEIAQTHCGLKDKTIDSLEAKLAAAEKALEPFAKAALGYDDPDETGPWPDIQDVFVTLGDCRRASAALGGKPS